MEFSIAVSFSLIDHKLNWMDAEHLLDISIKEGYRPYIVQDQE